MEINIKPLNKGEIYCCSLKSAKELFKSTSVYLNFTFRSNEFHKGLQHPLYHYANRNIKGKVLAYALISLRQENPLINFFELKESEYTKELREEFEKKFLFEFYKFYQASLNDTSLTADTKLILVEFIDGKLKLHEAKLKF